MKMPFTSAEDPSPPSGTHRCRYRLPLCLVVLAWACLASYAQTPSQAQGLMPTGFDEQAETPHFVLLWRSAETTPEEIEAAKTLAEDLFAKIQAYLGPQNTPEARLILLLEGEARSPDGQYSIPHVDGSGRIHIYRFGDRYFGELAHEMVHAFRRFKRRGWDGFLEEGFAELVALTIHPETVGFPRYGFPLTVVAGQWLVNDEAIPLQTLRQRHRELSLKCQAQSYTLRASFFIYLKDTFGKEAMLRLVYGHEPAVPARYEAVFGHDFDTLVVDWREDLMNRFTALEEAQQEAREYREKTSIRYMTICQAGQDF